MDRREKNLTRTRTAGTILIALGGILGLFSAVAFGYAAFGFIESSVETQPEAYAPKKAAVAELAPATDLLPDLVPLPPRDFEIFDDNGTLSVRFSATYFNRGPGPLELQADPETKGLREDVSRTILQRIYRADGTFSERRSGSFLWHEEHGHFHFGDFALYDLRPREKYAPSVADASIGATKARLDLQSKATFCIRDVSVVHMELLNRADDAGYRSCGRERQGVSVGWGDSYLAKYPGQSFDISELDSGLYELTVVINPLMRFVESDYDNNKATAVIVIDKDARIVEVLREEPSQSPLVEHIYREQVPEEKGVYEGEI